MLSNTLKYTFYIRGISTKADKARNIAIGDIDVHVIKATSKEEALSKCTLDNPIIFSKYPLSKDW